MLTKNIRSEIDSNVMKREGENASKVKYLTVTGFMAALITIMTYIRIRNIIQTTKA